MLPTSFSH